MKPTANLRLRRAIQTAGLTFQDIANETEANLKTVQRWAYEGRTPRSRRAERVAELLGVELFWLWPDLSDNRDRDRKGVRDSYQLYSRASALPPSFFRQVMLSAAHELFILTDNEWLLAQLEVTQRVAYIKRPMRSPSPRLLVPSSFVGMYSPGVLNAEVRRHHGVMGTSVIRADDTMILIPGDVGLEGPSSPVLLLSHVADDDSFDCYVHGFETLWKAATAMTPGEHSQSALGT